VALEWVHRIKGGEGEPERRGELRKHRGPGAAGRTLSFDAPPNLRYPCAAGRPHLSPFSSVAHDDGRFATPAASQAKTGAPRAKWPHYLLIKDKTGFNLLTEIHAEPRGAI